MYSQAFIINASGETFNEALPTSPVYWIDIQSAAGPVQVITNEGNFDRVQGDVIKLEKGTDRINLRGAAGVVILCLGTSPEDFLSHSAAAGGGGPVNITDGQYPNYTPVPVSPVTARMVSVGMFSEGGPGLLVSQPFRSTLGDSQALSVGSDNFNIPLYTRAPTTGGGFQATGLAGVRLTIGGAWSGTFRFNDGTPALRPVPFWTDDGAFYPTGILPSGFNGFVNFDVTSLNFFFDEFVAGAGAIDINGSASRLAAPQSPVITSPAANRLRFNYDGAIPAGNFTIVPAVAGRRLRVFGYNFGLDVASDIQLQNGVATATKLSAKGFGVVAGAEVDEPLFETLPGDGLGVFSSGPVANASFQFRYMVI